MSEDLKESILEQELDDDQLNLVVGGGVPEDHHLDICIEGPEKQSKHCITDSTRDAKTEGCAATVEANSWCKRNDACLNIAIDYIGCFKADVDCVFSYKNK